MSLRPEHLPRRSSNIFINYRRDDSAGHAGRLFDRLSSRFPDRVFMDIDTIEPGLDFVETIENAVGCCEVLIVMIGREWLNLEDATGGRRVDNPSDFVRLEIAAALERNIRIIPVLVEEAVMPRPEELPPEIARLTRRNAIALSDVRWAFDVDRLIQAIEVVLQEKAPSALLPVVKALDRPAASEPAPVRERTRPHAWLALSVSVLLGLTGWTGWNLASQMGPRKTERVIIREAPVAPAMQPPASPNVVRQPSEPPAPSAVASSSKTTRSPKDVDVPRREEQLTGSKAGQGRFGSLVKKGKGAFKNLRDRAKRGAGEKGNAQQEDDEKQSGDSRGRRRAQ